MYSFIKLSIFSVCFLIFITTASSSSERREKSTKCGSYEHYKCGSPCQTECSKLGQSCHINSKKCKKGCYCDKGYARDHNNRCVLIKECPNIPKLNCDKRHEHFACGGACQTTCKNYGREIETCPIVNIKCNDDCYCNDGYARDDNNRCIPVWQCPDYNGPKECPKHNEHYEIGQVCEKQCATLDQPCNYLSTIDGCYCNEGYARNELGDCIPIEECPSLIKPCGCHANEDPTPTPHSCHCR